MDSEAILAATMAEAFDSIDLAVVVLDAEFHIVFVNDGYRRLFDLDEQVCRAGANFVDVVWILTDRGEFGAGDVASIVTERLLPIRERQKVCLVRARPDGRILEEIGAPLASGGYTYSFSDVTLRRQASERLKAANRATVQALADLAEFRDNDTGDHVVRVARLTHEITRTLDQTGAFSAEITPEFRAQIGVASILHDVGKVAISDEILRKPAALDAAERLMMQEHSAAGAAILGKALILAPDSTYLRAASAIARHHHERYDGGGYPDGLAGDKIPLAARIVAVADVFDALISSRPYKQSWTEDEAAAYLASQAGRQFDPTVIEAALTVLEERKQTPVIRWTEAMSVGNPVLDRDHRILIGLVNQMSLPANREDREVLEFVLDELLDYTIAHFAREEEHMRRVKFSGGQRHEEIHRALTSQLVAIRADFMTGKGNIGDEVADFVAAWLRNHILEEDRRYTL
ncbi:MAG: bacteriohemerythrin [Magnetospirillum sp.]|nr:bacteriohemerythrin [Magnetospirillum sp.]